MELIGYTPLSKDGKTPHRSARSNNFNKPKNSYHPPRIYTSERIAAQQSPIKKAEPVYMNPVV